MQHLQGTSSSARRSIHLPRVAPLANVGGTLPATPPWPCPSYRHSRTSGAREIPSSHARPAEPAVRTGPVRHRPDSGAPGGAGDRDRRAYEPEPAIRIPVGERFASIFPLVLEHHWCGEYWAVDAADATR